MAVVKAAKGGQSLGRAIDYAGRDGMASGKDCPDDLEQAKEQMQATKEAYEKTDGRQYKHYVQSFEPGETTKEEAHEVGKEWAEKNFPGHEVVVGTHADKDHIHNHVIVNSVNYENGKKIHLSKDDLERLKTSSDEICKDHGLSTIDRTKERDRGEIRAYSMDKYQTIAQGKSYVAATAQAVERGLQQSQGKGYQQFIDSMNAQGYKVEWRGEKNITFEDKDGHRVRSSNLAKTFSDDRFSRDGIESIVQRQPEHKIEQEREKERTPEFKMQTVAEIKREAAQVGRGEEKIGIDIQDSLTGEKARQEAARRVLEQKAKEQEKAKELSRPKPQRKIQRDDPYDRGR